MKANKDYSKALIDCWFMHTCCSHKVRALYKPESLCMHFFAHVLYCRCTIVIVQHKSVLGSTT